MAAAEDVKTKAELANEAGREFVKLFYETFDKRRHMIGKLYMDEATLLWNGNAATGQENIMKFIGKLPASEHTLESLDVQPIPGHVTAGQTSMLVSTMGSVKYHDNKTKTFTQNFMLTAQSNKWKIVSDCIRTVD